MADVFSLEEAYGAPAPAATPAATGAAAAPAAPAGTFSLDEAYGKPAGAAPQPSSGGVMDTAAEAARATARGAVKSAGSTLSGGAAEADALAHKMGYTQGAPNYGVGALGERIKKYGEETFPPTPGQEESTTNALGETVGGLLPIVGAGLVGGVPGIAAATGMGALQAGDVMEQRAAALRKEGKTVDQNAVDTATLASGAVGALIGVIPGADRLLHTFMPATQKAILAYAARTAASGATGFTIGSMTTALNDAVEKYTMNPEKVIGDGMMHEGALLGAASMLTHGAVVEPVQALRARRAAAAQQQQPGAPPAGEPPAPGATPPGETPPPPAPPGAAPSSKLAEDFSTMGDRAAKEAADIAAGKPAAAADAENRPGAAPGPAAPGPAAPGPAAPTHPGLPENPINRVDVVTPPEPKVEEPIVPPAPPHEPTPEAAAIDEAANEANTSPTEAQQKAGNYKKGHVDFQGLDITIENPRGSTRSGVDRSGKPWSVEMPAHYGYVKGTKGADKDHVDVYVGPNPESERAFIVDQVDPETRKFDEHKVMLGFPDKDAALRTYSEAFTDGSGPDRIGNVSETTVGGFKDWLKTEDTTKPAAEAPPAPAPAEQLPLAAGDIFEHNGRRYQLNRDDGRGTVTARDLDSKYPLNRAFGSPEAFEKLTGRKLAGAAETPAAPANDTAALEAKLHDQVRLYASGMSRVGDLKAGTHAWGGYKSRGIGVDVGELSGPAIETAARAVVDKQAHIFVDSGAFSAFKRGLRTGDFTPLDFDKILERYDTLLQRIHDINHAEPKTEAEIEAMTPEQRLEHEHSSDGSEVETPKPLLVMPDIVGDQAGSLELAEKYAHRIRVETEFNLADPVVPIQKGELSLAEAYKKLVDTIGTDKFIVGIPSNEKAVTLQELRDFLAEAKPKYIHFLGAGSDRTLKPRIKAIADAGIEPEHLSADANLMRSKLYGLQAEGVKRPEAIVDTLTGLGGKERDALVNGPTPEEPSAPPENVVGSDNGIQAPIPPGNAGEGPADVHGTAESGPAGQPRPGEGGRGEGDATATPGPAPGEGDHGAGAGGGGEGPGDAAGLPPGGGGAGNAGHAGEPAAPQPRPDARVKGTDFLIEPGAVQEARSPRQKAEDNLAAIDLAKTIIADGRPATREEQAILAKYVGWGGLAGAFPGSDAAMSKGFEQIGGRLKAMLTPEEYRAASKSTQYAHYTAENVIRSMWDAAKRMGFKGGSIFEPGMGVGHFRGMMSPDLAEASRYQGIEVDPLTAQIAKLLYPQSGVRQADFIKTAIPENAFDLVIGNPPFSDVVIRADPKYVARGFMLHDYFFAKSLDSVRPGGLLAFVTSAGTMNKLDSSARDYMAARAEFVGGVRLPSTAFKQNAGTEVTTDILFFKKREQKLDLNTPEAEGTKGWRETVQRELPGPEGQPVPGNVNRYFSEHPEQVLGREGFFDKLYKGRYGVHDDGRDLTTELKAALDRLPADVMTAAKTPEQLAALDFASGQKKDGSFYMKDGQLMQYREGAGRAVVGRGAGVKGGMTAADTQRVTKLIPMRDALRDVFAADLSENAAAAAEARQLLNKHYDAFVKEFGPINKAEYQYRRPSVVQQETARAEAREEARGGGRFFNEGEFDPTDMIRSGASWVDIARARTAAREAAARAGREFDEGHFDPADMPDNVIEKLPNIIAFMDDPESYRLRAVENYDDATGKASKRRIFTESILAREEEPKIASVNDGVLWSLNKHGKLDLDAIAEKMGRDREAVIAELGDNIFKVPGTHDTYQSRDEYLSGDVTDKLAAAKAAAGSDPDVRRNIEALEKALPSPLAPSEITMTIGMPWMPPEVIAEFARDRLQIGTPKLRYAKALGQWLVDKYVNTTAPGMAEWGTNDLNANKILTAALNRQPPKVTRTEKTADGSTHTYVDKEATQAAQDKYERMREAFNEWALGDPKRADKLAQYYNTTFNRTVLRKYDGSYLTTPGVSADWSWRPHQQRVVARIIQSGNTYMAHAVGAGKTSAMIGSGMEMRRLGLVKKPMYVVPNHMLPQFTKEFYQQYPTARIAVADERRFHTDRRKQFMANVAQEDLDAVIITHSSFGKIPISEEFQAGLIHEEIAKLDEALSHIDKKDDRITVKKLENQKEKLEQKLSARGSSRQDKTQTFEEMGVDFAFIDEAHEFRKLSFATKQNLKGIDGEGSDMAWDLYTKLRYLDSKSPGRSAVLASGTPVTNTMGELYSLSRYLQREALEKRGLDHFDSWAAAFGDIKSGLEQTADGGYQPVTRFAKFVNIPELYKMVGETMDVVTSKELDQYVVRPKLAGGERKLHLAPKTPELEAYQQELGGRMRAIAARRGPPSKGDDILLSVINDGRHAAIDMRFVDAGAPRDGDTKLNRMVDNVFDIWKSSKNHQFYDPATEFKKPLFKGPATQIVFANLGINPSEKRPPFSGYQWLKHELIRRGVPANEIAFIRDYKTNVAKQRLFNDMNAGKVRILVGSSKKMGTGLNVQRRLLALHNQDPLWYPADDEQRVGRILRQGNLNPEIQVHDYSTKGTYDSSMWQMMANKGRFIEQFFRGDPELRNMEDLGEASLYEQASAIATSDERIIKLTEMKQSLEKMERRQRAFDSEQYAMRQRAGNAERELQHYQNVTIPLYEKEIAQRQDTRGDLFKMQIGNKVYATRKDAATALGGAIERLFPGLAKEHQTPLAVVGGFEVYLGKTKGENPEYYIKRGNGELALLGRIEGPAGLIGSVESFLRNLEDNKAYFEKQAAEAQVKLTAFRKEMGKQFTGGGDIKELAGKVQALESELRGEAAARAAPPQPPQDPQHALRQGEAATGTLPADAHEQLRAELDRVGLKDVSVKLVDAISDKGKPADARYWKGAIEVAKDAPGGLPTMKALVAGHEAVHAMRDLGLFTPGEWRAVEGWADRFGRQRYGIDERYGDSSLDQRREEAFAHLARDAAAGAHPGGLIGRAIRKIASLAEALGNWARGNGFNSAQGIAGKIQSGEIGARPRQGALEGGPQASLRDVAGALPDEAHERAKRFLDEGGDPYRMGKIADAMKGVTLTPPQRKALFLQNPDIRRWVDERTRDHPNLPPVSDSTLLGMHFQKEMLAQKRAGGQFALRDTVDRTREAGRGAFQRMRDFAGSLFGDLQNLGTPMAAGSEQARGTVKDFANAERVADQNWQRVDEAIKKNFTPAERAEAGRVLDEASVAAQQGRSVEPILARLHPEMRRAVEKLEQYGAELWDRAASVGMVRGEKIPWYMTRMAVLVGEDGSIGRVGKSGYGATSKGEGSNIYTTTPQLRRRQYLRPEETEAALRAKFGPGASLVHDIRALPLALARFEKAIAGRELINNIREMGTRAGADLVRDGASPGYFTLDHPAFTRYQPRLRKMDEPGPRGGTWESVKDDQGNPIFDKVPIYVRKDFEGPLRAVMTQPNGAIYGALMGLKGRAMSAIMYSPLIHNAVEWGRAFPLLPGKVLSFKIYFEGNAAKKDPAQMREAVENGMAPIGHRGFNQDITGIAEEASATPGRGLTAKGLGLLARPFGAEMATRRAVDAAGDFWHNTLLWDRVGDLQMGIYKNIRDDLVGKGMDARTAGRTAAHMANRFAGALPREAMSAAATKLANMALFSRTFTLGNLGVLKDAVMGLPRDVQAQIMRDGGMLAHAAAQSATRSKAIHSLVMDLGLLYVGNALLQTAFDKWKEGKDWDQIGQGYVNRFHALIHTYQQNPLEILNPLTAMEMLSPTYENEETRRHRIRVGHDARGTAIYARNPAGKVTEDFIDWLTSPLETLKKKLSTFVRPALNVVSNDQGFGRHVYDPYDKTVSGMAKAAGNVVWHFMQAQLPVSAVEGVADIATQPGDHAVDTLKAVGPLAGVTFSSGAPGGEARGDAFRARDRYEAAIKDSAPRINKIIDRGIATGNFDEAVAAMVALRMSPGEIRARIQYRVNPAASLQPNKRLGHDVRQHATPEERERIFGRFAPQ